MRLSIVIPAYNEEHRLSRSLSTLLAYLKEHYSGLYDAVIVDDGSTDQTAAVVSRFMALYPCLRLLRLPGNRGRGAAVREGVHSAQGELILETDADGSVHPEAIVRFAAFLESRPEVDVLIGSRNIPGAEILTPQPWLRFFLGLCFLYAARTLFGRDIQDYTLGFKMFRREAARDIFSHQFENAYLAEAEIVVVTRRRNWRLEELPVHWSDYRDSRVRPMRDSWLSLKGLVRILAWDRRGDYSRDRGSARRD